MKATQYTIGIHLDGVSPITIEARQQRDDTTKWAICCKGMVYNHKTRGWVYEMMPSGRTLEFIKQTRFSTEKKAIKCAKSLNLIKK